MCSAVWSTAEQRCTMLSGEEQSRCVMLSGEEQSRCAMLSGAEQSRCAMLSGEEQSRCAMLSGAEQMCHAVWSRADVPCCLEQSRAEQMCHAVWRRAEQMCHAVWSRAEQMYYAARSRAEKGCTMLSGREQSRTGFMPCCLEEDRLEYRYTKYFFSRPHCDKHILLLTISNKILLYKLLLCSMITYAAPVWSSTSLTNYRHLQVYQSKCLRVTGDFPRRTPISNLHTYLQMIPIR